MKVYKFKCDSCGSKRCIKVDDGYKCEYCGKHLSGLVYAFNDNSYCVTAYVGESTEVIVPATYNDGINGEYPVTVSFVPKTGKIISVQLVIMKSDNIKSLFLVSENPEEQGREWVDTSKSNKAKGEMICLNADGSVSCTFEDICPVVIAVQA